MTSTLSAKARQRGGVVIGGGGHAVGDVACGRVAPGLEDMGHVAEARRGDRQHAAQLAAAENADGAAGGSGSVIGRAPRGSRPTAPRARCPAGWPAPASLQRQGSAAAISPALAAPRPDRHGRDRIARAASGRWNKGCRRRQAPWSAPARRSPAGGSWMAIMPGRCAAPPAPAMITCSPRVHGGLAIVPQPVGRAVGRDDLRLVGDAQFVQNLGGLASWSASRTGCP